MGVHDVYRVCRTCGRKFLSNKLSPNSEAGLTCLGCWTRAHPEVVVSLGGGALLTFAGAVPEPVAEVPEELFARALEEGAK